MTTSAISRQAISQLTLEITVKKFYGQIRCWLSKSRSRKQLAELPDYLLDDVGISKHQARTESRRVFWD
ncbi:DUF1127 domain-containing protein [Vibrio paucivorans]|uniref:DUF1127 domain-containing protein n=1 Tax=Vibrio paucivorans TaxID=2829489 RepID=A0A9X3CEX7_9VIBR|nr:DUF1127 domain-containing protein [Vibrio paucivorans]MCW8334553.1 DUF1127 domain-containing protein [Vibrio paucivorans]